MNNIDDFVIEDGVLTEYKGSGGNVIIPEGVTNIGNWAFDHCSGLTSVTIPEGVTNIGYEAFAYCSGLTSITIPKDVTSISDNAFYECSGLTSVTIPEGVTSIGGSAFSFCSGLTSITIPEGVKSIGNYAFYGCSGLTSINISESVKKIGSSAFSGCKSLADKNGFVIINGFLYNYFGSGGDVTIPDGVTSIGNSAFGNCKGLKSVTLPKSVTDIGELAFEYCNKISNLVIENPDCMLGKDAFGTKLPKGLIEHIDHLFSHMTDIMLKKYVVLKLWNTLSAELQAEIFAYRQSKALLSAYEKSIKDEQVEPLGEALLDLLDSDPSATVCNSVAAYIKLYSVKAPLPLLRKLFEKIKSKKQGTKACKKLENDPEIMGILTGEVNADDPLDTIIKSILMSKHLSTHELELRIKDYYGLKASELPELRKQNGTAASPAVLMYLLTAHETTKVYSSGKQNVVSEYDRPGLLPEAVDIVSLISDESLQSAVYKLGELMLTAKARGKKMFLAYPVCRYANEGTLRKLTEQAEAWQPNPYEQPVPPMRTFRKAVLYNDTKSAVLFAAKYRDMDNYAEIRKTNVDVIRDSLLLSLAEEERAENTSNDQVISLTKAFLFDDFLSGRKRDSKGWQNTYLRDSTLHSFAGALVWEQSGNYFTVTEDQTIDTNGNTYKVTEEPIRVAHPIDMTQDEISAWQKYYNKHKIKQLFTQIWEPVFSSDSVKEDRYIGAKVEIKKLKNLDRHGIHYVLEPFSYVYSLNIEGCELSYESSNSQLNYDPSGPVYFRLGKFTYQEYSRKTNHIVIILDKLTAEEKIKLDDINVIDMMPGFTLAQITDFIAAAQEANAVNVLAALMEYKNSNFADFDPMDEFTLEW